MSHGDLVSIGPYRLFQSLKKGGMARVYLGLHVDTPQSILAIKTLLPELADKPTYRDMFSTEGKVGRLLSHRHIVRTLDHGREGKTDFIVMEYLQGFDLSGLLRQLRKQGRVMPLPVALTLARAMAEGLMHAHEQVDELGRPLDIVNRDVSPGNVMITVEGGCKLIDFGIAQTTVDVRSQIGSIKGKISHMSPEQVRGLPVDQRSDLFSLGTVIYQMLTGINVFQDDGEFATMERVRSAEAPPPSRHNPALDPDLDALVLSTMAAQAHDRPHSARAFVNALKDYMADRGITPAPDQVAACLQQAMGPRLRQLESDVSTAHLRALQAMGLAPRDPSTPVGTPPPSLTPQPAPPQGPRRPRWLWAAVGGAVAGVGVALWLTLRGG